MLLTGNNGYIWIGQPIVKQQPVDSIEELEEEHAANRIDPLSLDVFSRIGFLFSTKAAADYLARAA